ncbi:hypothetical protein MMON_46010 [Mycolicibacterium monacense]|uniref:Uncharacterized protein n=1 Tax=Mycolicibacterium monacense TaxID=85693 RepID=A0AAD1J0F5_MYCMB|nr:hypothetical protein MMON_46010 [Mycolicibacterium monacense]
MDAGLLTVECPILPMRCTAGKRSGTVLWSHLLLMSRETVVTRVGMGQGGGVRQVLPLRHEVDGSGMGARS